MVQTNCCSRTRCPDRQPDRRASELIAADYDETQGSGSITGGSNSDAASAELVIVAVPYEGHADLLSSLATELAGKIVVDCVNPLGFDQRGPFQLGSRLGGTGGAAASPSPR